MPVLTVVADAGNLDQMPAIAMVRLFLKSLNKFHAYRYTYEYIN